MTLHVSHLLGWKHSPALSSFGPASGCHKTFVSVSKTQKIVIFIITPFTTYSVENAFCNFLSLTHQNNIYTKQHLQDY